MTRGRESFAFGLSAWVHVVTRVGRLALVTSRQCARMDGLEGNTSDAGLMVTVGGAERALLTGTVHRYKRSFAVQSV